MTTTSSPSNDIPTAAINAVVFDDDCRLITEATRVIIAMVSHGHICPLDTYMYEREPSCDSMAGAEKEKGEFLNPTDATVIAEDMGTRTQDRVEKQNEGVSSPFRCRVAAGHLIDAFEYLPHADLSRLAALQS